MSTLLSVDKNAFIVFPVRMHRRRWTTGFLVEDVLAAIREGRTFTDMEAAKNERQRLVLIEKENYARALDDQANELKAFVCDQESSDVMPSQFLPIAPQTAFACMTIATYERVCHVEVALE